NARLEAGAGIIRALFAGERVTRGGPIPVENAELYPVPAHPVPLMAAALSPETAQWAGGWADGLLTLAQSRETLDAIISAFRRGGGEGKPVFLQVHLSWAETEDEARTNAFAQWRGNALDAEAAENLATPEAIEAHTAAITP